MTADRTPHLRRPLLAAAVVMAAGLALSGCVDAPVEPTPDPAASPSTSPSSDPTPTTTPSDSTEPLAVPCDELLPAQAVYDFSPTLQLVGAWEPEADSAAAEDLAAGGTLCRWVAESGGGGVDVSVARYPEARLTDLKNAAFADSQMVPTYGTEGYFEVEDGVGVALVFRDDVRLAIASVQFAEPGEVTPLVEAALASLAGR